jgi:hypothetical protein
MRTLNWLSLFLFIGLTFFINLAGRAQEVDSMMTFVNRKGKTVTKSGDEIYAGAMPGYSNRSLKENPGLFSKPLGERENEFGNWYYSFQAGFRTNLKKWLLLDVGFEYLRSGEQYAYEQDSVYKYVNTYHFIGIPIKLAYQYGNRFKLQVGAGIVPKMFMRMDQVETLPNEYGQLVDVQSKYTQNFNFFNVDAVITAGFRWNAGKRIGIYVLPEARWQLLNTYGKQNAYIHKSRIFGISAGLTFLL